MSAVTYMLDEAYRLPIFGMIEHIDFRRQVK